MSELLRAVRDELERCAVGRDNPTHRRLVGGELAADELRAWACQQWLWHREFPGVLATLAAGCPDPELRGALLRRAALEDGALPDEGPGRCAEWERVALAFGVHPDELAAAAPTRETREMIAVQRAVAARPFPEAWAGIAIGVDAETQLHSTARRRALSRHYAVPEEALAYIRVPEGDPVEAAVAAIEPRMDGRMAGAREALGLVLRARWNYFSGLAQS